MQRRKKSTPLSTPSTSVPFVRPQAGRRGNHRDGAEVALAPATHGLREEGRRLPGSEAVMWLTAFSVGTRRASCGKCQKAWGPRQGIEMEGRSPLQGRGYRDSAKTHERVWNAALNLSSHGTPSRDAFVPFSTYPLVQETKS